MRATATTPVLVLTGAGISAESGIPTFRGKEGYWRIGATNYRPEELATRDAFDRMPEEVWGWYLYRRAVCRAAQPNAAHLALVELERRLGDGFLLVTQNVDGLHLRAGHTTARTYQIHGNIDYLRCASDCGAAAPTPIPPALGTTWPKGRQPTAQEMRSLACGACGGLARPHVLWFDESYDEPLFRYESSLRAAAAAASLIVIGTSGATTLPARICELVARRGVPMIVVGPEETPFSALARNSPAGEYLCGSACAIVPGLVEAMSQSAG